MADTASDTVLKRMAEAGRGHPAGAVPTPLRAFGHAVAKAAQDMFQLPLRVTEAADLRASLAELPERLADRALLAVMAGPGERLGLVAVSPEVLATLIEMQTTKRIGAAEVAPRRPTRTDAAMSMRFIDRMMEEIELLLAADPAIAWAGGFRYGSFLDDPRPLGLLFEDAAYRILHLTLALGTDGRRQGTLLFAVPAEGRGAMPRPAADAAGAGGVGAGPDPAGWSARMEHAVMSAHVQVEAVLDRFSLPLADVMAFVPGMLVAIAPGALTRLRIEGHGRRLLATGRLGQCQGNLAFRLHHGPDGDGDGDAGAASHEDADAPRPAGTARAAEAAGAEGDAGQ